MSGRGTVDASPRARPGDPSALSGGTPASATPVGEAVDASTQAVSAEQAGLPAWVAPGVLAVLALLAGGVVLLRRRAAARP